MEDITLEISFAWIAIPNAVLAMDLLLLIVQNVIYRIRFIKFWKMEVALLSVHLENTLTLLLLSVNRVMLHVFYVTGLALTIAHLVMKGGQNLFFTMERVFHLVQQVPFSILELV